MIKKLKHRFIRITMISLSIVLLLLVGSINAISFYRMNEKANITLQLLSENEGKFPKFDKEKDDFHIKKEDFKIKEGFGINEETQYRTRYFIVDINIDQSAKQIDTSNISSVSSTEALEYAEEVLQKGKTTGYDGVFKYIVVANENGSKLIFVDCRDDLETVLYTFLASCCVAAGTLILVFILVSIFSKRAINPIIENMEKQKQFITDAGHEIKTPLAIISANADVLELTGGESEWITSIRNQTTRLDKLVKNLLTLAKMDEGNIALQFAEFDLSSCVNDIASSFTALAETQNKGLELSIQPELKIMGDEGCMQQLVSTLMDNAMKYSNEKGIIKVILEETKKGVRLEVYNTVEKIETKNLDRLFDRFHRDDASRSRETGGYGIGLSIAKSIVEAHHGKISARSEDGKSISFIITL